MTRWVQWVLSWCCVCVVSLSLLGCQNQPDTSNTEHRMVLEFWTLQLKDFANLIEPMLADFEATHPNVSVKWVDVPFSQGEKRMLTAVMSGQVPDVVNLNPEFSALLASRNALVDMNVAVPSEVRERYVPAVWQAVSVQDSSNHLTKEGKGLATLSKNTDATFQGNANKSLIKQTKSVGLPWYVTSKMVMVNQQLLNKVGWGHSPKNMKELAKLCADVVAYNNAHPNQPSVYAMMPTLGKSGYVLKQLYLQGVINDWQGLDSAESMAWLQQWVDLYQGGGLPAESLLEGPQAALDRYQSGQLILMEAGANYLNIVKENAPTVYQHTQVANQFAHIKGRIDFSTMLLAVPTQSKHPQLATELAAFITRGRYQLDLAQAAPVLPSVLKALDDPFFKANSTDKIDVARGLSAHQLKAARDVLPMMARKKESFAWIDHYVQGALLGTITVPKAMQEAKQAIATVQASSS